MSPSKLIPLVVFLVGSLGRLPGHAQELRENVSPTFRGQTALRQGGTEAVVDPGAPSVPVDTPVVPFSWAPDSFEKWPWNDSSAARAARVDPGILIYTEPPAGTDMPTLTPPETVDSEMAWPPEP